MHIGVAIVASHLLVYLLEVRASGDRPAVPGLSGLAVYLSPAVV